MNSPKQSHAQHTKECLLRAPRLASLLRLLLATVGYTLLLHSHLSAKEFNFDSPKSAGVTAWLVIPDNGEIVARSYESGVSTIKVRLDDGEEGGLNIQVRNTLGKVLWSHTFEYNLSASEGNSISVEFHKSGEMILLHYEGYRWDHDHRLLHILGKGNFTDVKEYTSATRDILPTLRAQNSFDPAYSYWIYPLAFRDQNVEFECIPQQLPERQASHPFAQDQNWFTVLAKSTGDARFQPISAKIAHEGR